MMRKYFVMVEKPGVDVHSKICVDVGKLAQPEKRHGPPTRDLPLRAQLELNTYIT
jgi:hypothetical protein